MGSRSHQTVGALASERVPLPSPSRIIVPSRTIGSAVPVYFFLKYLVDQPPLTAAFVRVEQRGKTPKYVGGCCLDTQSKWSFGRLGIPSVGAYFIWFIVVHMSCWGTAVK